MLQFSNQRKRTSWTNVNPFQISFINSQLRTGFIPNFHKKERVLALAEGLEVEVSGFYHEILETKRVLAELEHSHQLLTNLLGRTQSIVSPIRKLPVEILQEIFEHYMSQWEYSLTIGSLSKHNSILPITQVCSHWRETAHSIPGLWSSISVDLNFFRHGSLDISYIKQYLSRSRNVPLKIAVSGSPLSNRDIAFSKAKQLWLLLLEHSRAWNTVNLSVSNQSFHQASQFLASRGEDPFLNLRSITMSDMSDPHSLSVNLERLTYLKVSYFSGTSLEELFDSCNHLEVCILGEVDCEDPDKDTNARSRTLTHQHLHELHLHSGRNFSPNVLLTLFFPKLKKLCVTKNAPWVFPDEFEIMALLERESGGLPRCSLESLHLAGFDRECADPIISTVQDTLCALSVQDHEFTRNDNILAGLSQQALPRLQTLDMIGDTMLTDLERAQELICALVESRCALGPNRSVIGLQRFKFTLDVSVYVSKELWEWQGLACLEEYHVLKQLKEYQEERATFVEAIRTRLAPLIDAGLSLELKVRFTSADGEDDSAYWEQEEEEGRECRLR